jgi:hypothetical protein
MIFKFLLLSSQLSLKKPSSHFSETTQTPFQTPTAIELYKFSYAFYWLRHFKVYKVSSKRVKQNEFPSTYQAKMCKGFHWLQQSIVIIMIPLLVAKQCFHVRNNYSYQYPHFYVISLINMSFLSPIVRVLFYK